MCTISAKCTTAHARRIKRWEHEHRLEAADAELKKHPDAMRERKQIVEHPYATIKHWMGSTHFLMKRLPNVQTEMSLHVLAYNLAGHQRSRCAEDHRAAANGLSAPLSNSLHVKSH